MTSRLNLSRDHTQSEVKVTPKKRKRDDGGASSFVQQTQSSSSSSSGFSTSAQCTGDLEVVEVSTEGQFIKIRNISSKV